MKKEIKLLLHNLIDKEMFLFLHPCNTQTLERKDRNVERDGEMPAAFNYLSNPNVVNWRKGLIQKINVYKLKQARVLLIIRKTLPWIRASH